jgi:hypothetical protein
MFRIIKETSQLEKDREAYLIRYNPFKLLALCLDRLTPLKKDMTEFKFFISGVTKRSLSWLTNSALVYEPKCGEGGSCGVSGSANEYSCTQEPK